MGCSPCKGNVPRTIPKGLIIEIVNPTNQEIQTIEYANQEQKLQEFIMNIMNQICFGDNQEDKIDGNFISIYNQKDDRFHYYCHRLIGIEIQQPSNPMEGKIWIPYINDIKMDWDQLVETNYKVNCKGTKITWKYDYFDLNDQNLKTQQSESTNISQDHQESDKLKSQQMLNKQKQSETSNNNLNNIINNNELLSEIKEEDEEVKENDEQKKILKQQDLNEQSVDSQQAVITINNNNNQGNMMQIQKEQIIQEQAQNKENISSKQEIDNNTNENQTLNKIVEQNPTQILIKQQSKQLDNPDIQNNTLNQQKVEIPENNNQLIQQEQISNNITLEKKQD